MRILYCSQDYCPHDHRFLSVLANSDHEVYWLRLEDQQRSLEGRAIPSAIHQVHWRASQKRVKWWQYPNLRQEFRQIIAEIKPDLIHAGPIQPVAILPAMIGFHPLVSMSWGFDMLQDVDRNVFWNTATRYTLSHSDWLFCDCHTVEKRAIRMGFPEDRIVVFPWGVDLERFAPTKRSSGASEPLTFLSTRSWEERYGIDVALKGFAAAVKVEPTLQLIMLSGGSQAEWIDNFIKDNRLQGNVQRLGQIPNDELHTIYHKADVYLSASHVDGSSVALMEALACGVPALVSDIPSNLEWVEHGKQGWVFQDNDPQDLTQKILEIAGSRDKIAPAGKLARKKAEQNADWKKNQQIMLDAYSRVMKSEVHRG